MLTDLCMLDELAMRFEGAGTYALGGEGGFRVRLLDSDELEV